MRQKQIITSLEYLGGEIVQLQEDMALDHDCRRPDACSMCYDLWERLNEIAEMLNAVKKDMALEIKMVELMKLQYETTTKLYKTLNLE